MYRQSAIRTRPRSPRFTSVPHSAPQPPGGETFNAGCLHAGTRAMGRRLIKEIETHRGLPTQIPTHITSRSENEKKGLIRRSTTRWCMWICVRVCVCACTYVYFYTRISTKNIDTSLLLNIHVSKLLHTICIIPQR